MVTGASEGGLAGQSEGQVFGADPHLWAAPARAAQFVARAGVRPGAVPGQPRFGGANPPNSGCNFTLAPAGASSFA
ncbi:hypothetical protein SAMN05444858_13015 [Micromonospora avicenniae]|uniref:Uncharacterized protein n=1 Tax=Micromonospora avicenniae TaxID=1198245 RepID=A0A1N7F436_9ACTN|nr:hypothetical protein SAMN05444858_13015 [Micromonospora avicenniae]